MVDGFVLLALRRVDLLFPEQCIHSECACFIGDDGNNARTKGFFACKIAQKASVIPLKDSTYRLVTNKLYRNVLGSAFAGKLPVGLTVGQVLERSFDEHKKPQFR